MPQADPTRFVEYVPLDGGPGSATLAQIFQSIRARILRERADDHLRVEIRFVRRMDHNEVTRHHLKPTAAHWFEVSGDISTPGEGS
jgi:hypothetical protein